MFECLNSVFGKMTQFKPREVKAKKTDRKLFKRRVMLFKINNILFK